MATLLLLFSVTLTTASITSFISADAFQHHGSTSRRLLQEPTPCSINFGLQNYTIVTSKFKAPLYPVSLCCSSFKEFACPFAEELNNSTTSCASDMFSYLNTKGSYPSGLFGNECKEGKKGVFCPDPPPPQGDIAASSGREVQSFSSLIVPILGFAVLVAACLFC